MEPIAGRCDCEERLEEARKERERKARLEKENEQETKLKVNEKM